MKKLSILSILCFAMLIMPKAFGWELAWYNNEQVLDQNGYPIAPGGLVQLIADGGGDGIDDPYDWWMSQPDPAAAMNAWLAAGCPPIDDDYLVVSTGEPNPQHVQDFGPGPDGWGWFGAYYINSGTPAFGSGVGLYTRFFTSEQPAECDYYGELTTYEGGLYQLDNATFPAYGTPGGQVDQHIDAIIPEPASISMLLGGIGLLLAFKRKK